MTQSAPGDIELPAEDMARLRRIAATPDDIEQLLKSAEVSRSEFLDFMDSSGLWEDPEYAQIAKDVLSMLEQRETATIVVPDIAPIEPPRKDGAMVIVARDDRLSVMNHKSVSGTLLSRRVTNGHLQPYQATAPSPLSTWMEKIIPRGGMLPWCHTTDAFELRKFIQRGELFSKSPSEVFGEPLSYFFYGRPAYNNERTNRMTASAPVVIMMSPDTLESRKRVFPFDTAAFVHGRYRQWMHSSMHLEDFDITPLADSPRRYVQSFYASNHDYLTLRPRPPTVDYAGCFEVESLISLLTHAATATTSEQRLAIELQVEGPLAFEWPWVRALILPRELQSTSYLSSFLAGPGRNVAVRWYDLSPLKLAEEYRAQLEHCALELQAEWEIL